MRVYKSASSDKYVPNEYDDVKHYEENDEYATFFFDKYEQAHSFVDSIAYNHPEYKIRPIKKISTDV